MTLPFAKALHVRARIAGVSWYRFWTEAIITMCWDQYNRD